jgi:hypothetical protein
MSKLWTEEDVATAAALWAGLSDMLQQQRAEIVGEAIGRTYHGVLHRYNKFGDSFDGATRGPMSAKHNRAPDHVLAERDRAIASDTRSPAAVMLGEPPPGRSALDRYTPPGPPRNIPWADAFGSRHSRLGGE